MNKSTKNFPIFQDKLILLQTFNDPNVKTLATRTTVNKELSPLKLKQKRIGFVPTMGALHEGHLELIRQAKEQCDVVICSIFVNPKQFNDKKDFQIYPRTIESDKAKLEAADCDFLYLPDYEDVYQSYTPIEFEFSGLDAVMEGKYRPGHFRGVADVVYCLFDAVKPDDAFFGIKDYQQVMIIKSMVKQTGLEVNIIPCETIRSEKGLALSSRNNLLNEENLEKAVRIYETMQFVKAHFNQEKIASLKQQAIDLLEETGDFEVDYLEITDAETLQPVVEKEKGKSYRIFVAAYIQGVRLIDNMGLS